MLGKLLKYEFKATGRMMLPFFGALAVLTLAAWTVMTFINTGYSAVLSAVNGIVLTLYFLSLVATGTVTLILIVYHFYRSFLSDEGYCTFSLPAGINSQLGAKLLCAAAWIAATAVLVVLSLLITTSSLGDFLRLPWGEMFERIYAETGIGAGSMLGYIFEIVLMLMLGALAVCLVFYASMSLGYGFSNHKVLYSVLIFIGIGIVTQILGVSVIAGAAVHVGIGYHGVYWSVSPERLAHGVMLGVCAAELVYCGVFYAVTALALKRRLNLQ